MSRQMRKLTGPCMIPGCSGKPITRQMCKKHYSKFWKYGNPLIKINASPGEGWITEDGYRRICINYVIKYEHVFLAEKALGHSLPPKAVIHHMNGDKTDNKTFFNLVVCPDQSYHKLIHIRTKEYEQFGRCTIRGTQRFPAP